MTYDGGCGIGGSVWLECGGRGGRKLTRGPANTFMSRYMGGRIKGTHI